MWHNFAAHSDLIEPGTGRVWRVKQPPPPDQGVEGVPPRAHQRRSGTRLAHASSSCVAPQAVELADFAEVRRYLESSKP